MADPALHHVIGIGRTGDGDSDYGSDFSAGEELLVDQLLEHIAPKSPALELESCESRHVLASPPAPAEHESKGLHSFLAADDGVPTPASDQRPTLPDPIPYPDLSRALSDLEPSVRHVVRPTPPSPDPDDTRSPIERFRSFPKRPLTVSDMSSGAWCELQHFYTLSLLPGGKKTKTAAMRGGTRVHKKLEDEVHSAVQVTIASKEEAFALRLWNIIQGLRSLRDTGLTRELEVWGLVDGQVINGVIDQVSYQSPNPDFEKEMKQGNSPTSKQQATIDDYLHGTSRKTVYLTDVKTRGTVRLPSGTQVRPARVQLFLYHRLLSTMASDKLNYSIILERYGLNGAARFSDAFMAQVGGLHDEIFYDADSEIEEATPDSPSTSDFMRYRSISEIVALLKQELRTTFPAGAASIDDLLAVEYRHRDDGRALGNNCFMNDPDTLDGYVEDTLRWWRGEREPHGVQIEETYKCGWCEFAENCQWRKDKEVEHSMKRKATRTLKRDSS
ncbi:hypothetical protein F5Y18DRAFT_43361 [Xylariaceae sp. FL1019]|nr:hypothetical protein F5Y18DRAFT_43361 [Xylariaceae sp. FL1019]